MTRRPPVSTRNDTLFPHTTLVRLTSGAAAEIDVGGGVRGAGGAQRVGARAERDAARLAGVARQREPVGARAEIDRARDGAVGNVEPVLARPETDLPLHPGGGDRKRRV